MITFDSTTLGTQTVYLYAIDKAGNWDFCTTYVIVQDNMDACNSTPEMALISGTIADWKGQTVEEVLVQATDNQHKMTKKDGQFDFELAIYNN